MLAPSVRDQHLQCSIIFHCHHSPRTVKVGRWQRSHHKLRKNKVWFIRWKKFISKPFCVAACSIKSYDLEATLKSCKKQCLNNLISIIFPLSLYCSAEKNKLDVKHNRHLQMRVICMCNTKFTFDVHKISCRTSRLI